MKARRHRMVAQSVVVEALGRLAFRLAVWGSRLGATGAFCGLPGEITTVVLTAVVRT